MSAISVVYVCTFLVVFVLVMQQIHKIWEKWSKELISDAKQGIFRSPNLVKPTIYTLFIMFAFVVTATASWNSVLSFTSHSSSYISPEEEAEKQKVQEAHIPTPKEMKEAAEAQKSTAQEAPHEAALDGFDAHMKQEARTIKQRNGEPNVP